MKSTANVYLVLTFLWKVNPNHKHPLLWEVVPILEEAISLQQMEVKILGNGQLFRLTTLHLTKLQELRPVTLVGIAVTYTLPRKMTQSHLKKLE